MNLGPWHPSQWVEMRPCPLQGVIPNDSTVVCTTVIGYPGDWSQSIRHVTAVDLQRLLSLPVRFNFISALKILYLKRHGSVILARRLPMIQAGKAGFVAGGCGGSPSLCPVSTTSQHFHNIIRSLRGTTRIRGSLLMVQSSGQC